MREAIWFYTSMFSAWMQVEPVQTICVCGAAGKGAGGQDGGMKVGGVDDGRWGELGQGQEAQYHALQNMLQNSDWIKDQIEGKVLYPFL